MESIIYQLGLLSNCVSADCLRADSGRLMSGHLPLSAVLDIHLERTDAKAVGLDHFHIDEAREHGSLAIDTDVQIVETEGFVPGRTLGDRSDVLRFVLGLTIRMRVGEIVGEPALERSFVLLYCCLRPAGR